MAAWTLPHRITDWCEILTTALDRRSRKYFLTIILGMLLGSGRRTVACWLRAAGVTDDWHDHYYFLQTLGRSAKRVATELLQLAGDASSVGMHRDAVARADVRATERSSGS